MPARPLTVQRPLERPAPRSDRAAVRRWLRRLEGPAYVAPALVVLGLVLVYPLTDVLSLSLYASAGRDQYVFVGLSNYQRLLVDPAFWAAFRNTLYFTVGSVVGHLLLGLGAALLLNQAIRGRALFRVVSLVPWMFSAVVVALTWRWMLDAQFGVINDALAHLGIRGPILWFEDPHLALPAVVLTNIWRGFPFASVTLLAALQAISRDQYEAASVDGASPLQQFRYITLPNLQFMLTIVAALDTIWNFKHFDLVQVMTNGGPAGATEVLTTLAYKVSFENFQFGYAAAMAVVMSVILLAMTSVYVRRVV